MITLDPRGVLWQKGKTTPQSGKRSAAPSSLGVDPQLLQAARTVLVAKQELSDDDVILALEMSKWQQGITAAKRDLLFIIGLATRLSRHRGSTCVALTDDGLWHDLFAALSRPQSTLKTLRSAVAAGTFAAVIGGAEDGRPLVLDGDHLYLDCFWQQEKRVVMGLQQLTQDVRAANWLKTASKQLELVLKDTQAVTGRLLNDEQRQAVLAAVSNRVTVITGGPGTGKTTIVLSILHLLLAMGVDPRAIALATPTGRATYRLAASIRDGRKEPAGSGAPLAGIPDPQTLHRLLSYDHGGNSRHHAGNQLTARWVIVDETSMTDLELMARLVAALPPDASLVLLGDEAQLPAVGAGAVFRDLAALADGKQAAGLAVVHLKTNHRNSASHTGGRQIVAVATRIRAGDYRDLVTAVGTKSSDGCVSRLGTKDVLPMTGVQLIEPHQTATFLPRFVQAWRDQTLVAADQERTAIMRWRDGAFDQDTTAKLGRLFEIFGASRVLCLTNHGPTGVQAMNELFHGLAAGSTATGSQDWVTGEPAMMTSNNYLRGIFNGDIGLVLSVSSDGEAPRLMAVFQRIDGFQLCSLTELKSKLVHAYATTVHKAQGGEHKHVALMLPTPESAPASPGGQRPADALNSRELLYTAITRAIESVTIVGSAAAFEAGVQRSGRRYTLISERMLRR